MNKMVIINILFGLIVVTFIIGSAQKTVNIEKCKMANWRFIDKYFSAMPRKDLMRFQSRISNYCMNEYKKGLYKYF